MKQFYTVAEISEIFALPKSTVYDLVKTGRVDYLRPTRLGGAIRFHKPTVDRHIKQLEAA
ncbi:helix-turn-helix domain-containing protein [Corynebacterium auriscanis]|uniref:helix-turn-helix domain-containing protein n=1 Tax=Corynebacterium auriscanis TaxID=99807 RepID=UPI003CEB3A8A